MDGIYLSIPSVAIKEIFMKKTLPLTISTTEILALLNISKPTLWRLTKNKGFPPLIDGMKSVRSRKRVNQWFVENGISD
jgi:predicted DNA-binding transcriptional regulator AlpA